MADIIRFPLERRRRVPPPPEEGWRPNLMNVTMTGPAIPYECTELIHNFDEVPGRCRCGERYWDPDKPEAS